MSPFLGDSLLCLSLEPGRGGEVHREDSSGIGVSPFEGQGSFLTRCDWGRSQLPVGSLAVKWAQLAVGSPKAPQSPQFSDPVRICVCRLRTPPVDTWPSLSPALLWVPFRLCNLSPLLFPSLGLASSLRPDHPSHPSPPGALLPTRETGSPSGKTGAGWIGWRGVSAEVGAPARPPSDLTFHQLTGNPHALGTPKKDSCNPKGRFKMQGVSSVSRKRDADFLPATVRVERATSFMQDKLLPLSRFSSSREREVPAVETQIRTVKS